MKKQMTMTKPRKMMKKVDDDVVVTMVMFVEADVVHTKTHC